MARRSIIKFFVTHKVAANVLIVLFLVLGCAALLRLHTRFLPAFGLNTVVVQVAWPGASSKDVEQAITHPIEQELLDLDDLLRVSSVSSQGAALIIVEFKQHATMSVAMQSVRDGVNSVVALPEDSKKPHIFLAQLYDPIARVVISTNDHRRVLNHWVHEAQQQLLDAGIDRVTVLGLPDERIRLTLTPGQLLDLGSHFTDIGQQLGSQSQNIASGRVGHAISGHQLRSDSQAKTPQSVRDLPIVSGDISQMLRVMDVALVSQQAGPYEEQLRYNDWPAAELTLFRTQQSDALSMAGHLHDWKKNVVSAWPSGVHVHVYYEFWKIIQQRIHVLLKNGLWGLALIYALLFVFLTSRIGIWVAIAVPLSVFGALFALWALGGSINMISLFALIMSFGIIVDDTIVVAEEGLRLHQDGEPYARAAIRGAQRMSVPIITASLTTIVAFSPLMLLSGVMGKVLFAIPLVVVCVILASLIECFFILPHHVSRSLANIESRPEKPFRRRLNAWFFRLRDHHYYRFMLYCIDHKLVLFSVVIVTLALSLTLLMSGRVPFTFFPSPDGTLINADAVFSPAATQQQMDDFIQSMNHAAVQASDGLSTKQPLLTTAVQYLYKGTDPYEMRSKKRLGSVVVELLSPEDRRVSNQQFIDSWQAHLHLPAWVESVRMMPPRKGMPGADIDFSLTGASPAILKQAALELEGVLASYQGVFNVTDNMPMAPNDIVFTLLPAAHGLGMTTQSIGDQLRSAMTGYRIQTHYQDQESVEMTIQMAKNNRSHLSTLEHFPILTPSGEHVPLMSLVSLTEQKNFDALPHSDARLTLNVMAEVDESQANTNQIVKAIQHSDLPSIANKYGVSYAMKGSRSMEEKNMFAEMRVALLAMLVVVYLILTWVSSSYWWPIFVMVAIPFGLEGAVFGHWLMHEDLTLLSLFGFFGLSGIVINDSIILLFRYKELLQTGLSHHDSIVQASCQRFRPVLLTSLTTIAGLAPLLFERSLQAQFLIPMAITICFGLVFSTALILVVIPALISLVYK